MTNVQAILNAIQESPDDAVSKLVYADALEETGEPNAILEAQLIRDMISGNIQALKLNFSTTPFMNVDGLADTDLVLNYYPYLYKKFKHWRQFKGVSMVFRDGFPHHLQMNVCRLAKYEVLHNWPIEITYCKPLQRAIGGFISHQETFSIFDYCWQNTNHEHVNLLQGLERYYDLWSRIPEILLSDMQHPDDIGPLDRIWMRHFSTEGEAYVALRHSINKVFPLVKLINWESATARN